MSETTTAPSGGGRPSSSAGVRPTIRKAGADAAAPPLRVAHLAKYYAPVHGGIESHVRSLAHAQSELGAEVEVVCLGHDSAATRKEEDGQVPICRVGRWASVGKLDVCPSLPSVLRALDVDLLHVHVPNPSMILGALLARPRVPIVVGYHSDHVNQPLLRYAFRPFEKAFFGRVARILTTSPPYSRASDLLPDYVSAVETLPLGLDLTAFRERSEEVEREASEIRVRFAGPLWFSCGRLVPYKGLVHAVRAMRTAPGTLLIAGKGPERESLAREIARAGLQERVHLLGAVPDVRPYMRAAHALWLPSVNRSEAFGMVQLEAMAQGCPVVNTQIYGSGVPWVSRDGESGLTVPPEDASALSRAASRLIAEPGLRDRLVEGCLRRVREFELTTIAARSLRIYESVLERNQTPSSCKCARSGRAETRP